MASERADVALVKRGLFESRAKAQAAIAAGLVKADGVTVLKANAGIADTARIEAEPAFPWVSRGGVKLAHALDHFGLTPEGLFCLDVGASTGGFTEVLLARGARGVVAVDTGHGQMHSRIRHDERLTVREGCDVRSLTPAEFRHHPLLATIDVSFISLSKVLPVVKELLAPQGTLVALIKPQFEAGRREIGKGGLVKDTAVQARVCADIAAELEQLGLHVLGLTDSPIAGGDGNREFLIAARKGAA